MNSPLVACIGGESCSVLAVRQADIRSITSGCVTIYAIFMVCQAVCKKLGLEAAKPSRDKYVASIISYHVTSAICLLYMSVMGTKAFISFENDESALARQYSYHAPSQHVLCVMISYYIVTLLLCISISPLYSHLYLVHHIISLGLCVLCLHPLNHYATGYFCGFAEFSTFLLCIVDMFDEIPSWANKYSNLNFAVRLSFAISFLVLRVVIWNWFTLNYCFDVYELIQKNQVQHMFPLMFNIALALPLTVLQLYWAGIVVKALIDALFSKSKMSVTKLE